MRLLTVGSAFAALRLLLDVTSPRAEACSPPAAQSSRCNPFACQGNEAASEAGLPKLPTNGDFGIEVMVSPGSAGASEFLPAAGELVRVAKPAARGSSTRFAAPAERRGNDAAGREVWFYRAKGPFDPNTRYELVTKTRGGASVRLFQFKTTAGDDTTAPTWSGVTATQFAGLHEPNSGTCDDGFARVLFRVGAPRDDVTPSSAVRYAVFSARADGTFERDVTKAQIATASCTAVIVELRKEVPRDQPVPARLHFAVAPMDLAGNLGAPSFVSIDTAKVGKRALSWNDGCEKPDEDLAVSHVEAKAADGGTADGKTVDGHTAEAKPTDAATSGAKAPEAPRAAPSAPSKPAASRGGCTSCGNVGMRSPGAAGAAFAFVLAAASWGRRRTQSPSRTTSSASPRTSARNAPAKRRKGSYVVEM